MIEASRGAILAELGDPPDITFVRGAGNVGDELIWAGTRELLAGRLQSAAAAYRERCFLTGKTVTIEQPGGQTVVGLCDGMDDAGALRLHTEQGEQKIVTTTDDAGQYTFNNLPAGAWTLQVEIFGFTPSRREVTIDDKPSTLDWTLELKPLSTQQPAPTPQPTTNIQRPTSVPTSVPPQPTRARSGRPSQAPASVRQNSGGFQNLSLNETAEGQAMAAVDGSRAADTVVPEAAGNANEAFRSWLQAKGVTPSDLNPDATGSTSARAMPDDALVWF